MRWEGSLLDSWRYFEIEISESYFYDGTYNWVRSLGGRRSGSGMFATLTWIVLTITYWFFAWNYRRVVVTKIENLFSKFMNKL